MTGSSAAAAVAAGAAALLAQARPALGAADLRGLMTGTARAVPGGEAAQGSGLVDAGAAAAAELVAEPSSLPLGRGAPGRSFRRTVVLRSLSPRRLERLVGVELEGRGTEGFAVRARRAGSSCRRTARPGSSCASASSASRGAAARRSACSC